MARVSANTARVLGWMAARSSSRVAVWGDEGGLDAHLLHGLVEQVEGAAVDGAGADHVEAGGADVQHGHKGGRLAGRGEHGPHAALQRGDLLLHHIQGRVAQTGVEEPLLLEVEQGAHLLGALVDVGGALNDGGHPWLPVFGGIPCVDAEGIRLLCFHGIHPFQNGVYLAPAVLLEGQGPGTDKITGTGP